MSPLEEQRILVTGSTDGLGRRVAGELDTLVNNAGVIEPERRESPDGLELTFAVNHLSHFLLTGPA